MVKQCDLMYHVCSPQPDDTGPISLLSDISCKALNTAEHILELDLLRLPLFPFKFYGGISQFLGQFKGNGVLHSRPSQIATKQGSISTPESLMSI